MTDMLYLQTVNLLYTTIAIREEHHKLQTRLEAYQRCYLLIICAWYYSRISVQPTDFPLPYNESHGICQACCTRFETELTLNKGA